MSDEIDQTRADLQQQLRFARTDWLACAGDVSLKLLEEAITLGASLGEVSWEEAVTAFQVQAVALIQTGMANRPPLDVNARQAYLAHLHVTRGNPNCLCRTASCGHRADQHTGPNGACLVCEQECWL